MTKTLPLSEVKIKFSELVDSVVTRDDEIVITRNGKPVAVLLNAEEYDSWKETQEIKSNPLLMAQIRKGLNDIRKGRTKKYASVDKLFK